ncbi:MAG: hypothetical protein ACK45I_08105 [Bacteroidota bacterium]|jgi:hypothetical protein
MSSLSIVLLLLVLIGIVLFMYGVLPRLTTQYPNAGVWFRILIFTGIAVYLGADFYSKQKYGYIFVLLLGSIAFYGFMRSVLKKKK